MSNFGKCLLVLLGLALVGCNATGRPTPDEEFKGVGETVHSPIDFDIHLLFKAAVDAVQKEGFKIMDADKSGGLILTEYKVTETNRLSGPTKAKRVRIKITETGDDYELFIQAISLSRTGDDWTRSGDDKPLAVKIGRTFYAEADRIYQQQRNRP